MPRDFKPIPDPEFMLPKGLPKLAFVPPNSRRAADGVQNSYVVKTDNLSLLLARYMPKQVIRNDKGLDVITEINPRNGRESVYLTLRSLWFEHCTANYTSANNVINDLLTSVYVRWQAMVAQAPASARFEARALGRVLVGFGGKGALDFGLTLSYITGLPTIPGSALKGVARAYGLLTLAADFAADRGVDSPLLAPLPEKGVSLLEHFDALLAAEKREDTSMGQAAAVLSKHFHMTSDELVQALDNYDPANLYRRAFGSQQDGGACVFYEAVVAPHPKPRPLFEIDVMTPHFKAYYDDANKAQPTFKTAPHDGQDPTPITFLTVAAGTRFAFAVGLRQALAGDSLAEQARGQAVDWLKRGLNELGVGAKTAAGYGVFDVS